MAKITGNFEGFKPETVVKAKYSYMLTAIVDGQQISFFDKDPTNLAEMLRSYQLGDYVTIDYTQKGQYMNGNYMILARRERQDTLQQPGREPTRELATAPRGATEEPTVLKGNEIMELELISDNLKAVQMHASQSIAYIDTLRKELKKNPIKWERDG